MFADTAQLERSIIVTGFDQWGEIQSSVWTGMLDGFTSRVSFTGGFRPLGRNLTLKITQKL